MALEGYFLFQGDRTVCGGKLSPVLKTPNFSGDHRRGKAIK